LDAYGRSLDLFSSGNLMIPDGASAASPKEGIMENYQIEELRAELDHLLKKQTEVLKLRTSGGASDADILEYEIRQEEIHEICNELANSAAA
jgi:hypothetical protein